LAPRRVDLPFAIWPERRVENICPRCSQIDHCAPGLDIRAVCPTYTVKPRQDITLSVSIPDDPGVFWLAAWLAEYTPNEIHPPRPPEPVVVHAREQTAALLGGVVLPGMTYVRAYYCRLSDLALSVASVLVWVDE
jgi:hypothetical protein